MKFGVNDVGFGLYFNILYYVSDVDGGGVLVYVIV